MTHLGSTSVVLTKPRQLTRQTSQTTLKLMSSTPKIREQPHQEQYKWDIRWRNVIFLIYLHYGCIVGLQWMFTGKVMAATILQAQITVAIYAMGITAGAHRLWSHKCYKARTPLRILLALCNAGAFQNSIYEWSRDHRAHHKFTDTDADPHNSKRGFFFSHMGWLVVRKHEDVKVKGKTVDMSDLEQDWVVMLQHKYYMILMPLICFVIPTFIPWYFWGEDLLVAWHVCALTRYCLTLHGTWTVNSVAHLWGARPYDKRISPAENIYVAILAYGEGWHNYHHAFPWDYKTSEFGEYTFNLTTAFIDFMARIGWAYDLKTVKPEMIAARKKRTGECAQDSPKDPQVLSTEIWGLDDKDMPEEGKSSLVATVNPKGN